MLFRSVRAARESDVAIVVIGSPESAESEGYDREHLDLPAVQDDIVKAVAEVSARTIVVVISGGPVRLQAWRERVDAVISTGLAGQGVSAALASILVGDVDPGGRLAETWPLELADTPSFMSFPGEGGRSLYGEGIFVGYRGHDVRGDAVAFPFGHGLSYTSTEYDDLTVVATATGWTAAVTVRNTGDRDGRDVVQIYVELPDQPGVRRAIRSLAGFSALALSAGAETRVSIEIPRRALERWDERLGRWTLDRAVAAFVVGRSSRDPVLRTQVSVDGESAHVPLTLASTMLEWLEHPTAGPALLAAVAEADQTGGTTGMLTNPMAVLMIGGLPIHRLAVDAGNAQIGRASCRERVF